MNEWLGAPLRLLPCVSLYFLLFFWELGMVMMMMMMIMIGALSYNWWWWWLRSDWLMRDGLLFGTSPYHHTATIVFLLTVPYNSLPLMARDLTALFLCGQSSVSLITDSSSGQPSRQAANFASRGQTVADDVVDVVDNVRLVSLFVVVGHFQWSVSELVHWKPAAPPATEDWTPLTAHSFFMHMDCLVMSTARRMLH